MKNVQTEGPPNFMKEGGGGGGGGLSSGPVPAEDKPPKKQNRPPPERPRRRGDGHADGHGQADVLHGDDGLDERSPDGQGKGHERDEDDFDAARLSRLVAFYHIGSTGFFLDHAEHITLTHDQQMALNGIKEKTMAAQADADRKIQEAEQKMWQLTAVDSPDEAKIEATARQTEKLRGDQRMAFIRAVGEAAKVLTPEQQQALLGTMPADAKKPMAPKMKM